MTFRADATSASTAPAQGLPPRTAADTAGTTPWPMNEAMRAALVALSDDVVFAHDLNGHLRHASPNWTALLGHPVEAVIGLARSLGMDVVAEGVETPAQLEALQQRGCHLIQGYLFARPMARQALMHLLAGGVEILPQRVAVPSG